jgi:hypothetical protein
MMALRRCAAGLIDGFGSQNVARILLAQRAHLPVTGILELIPANLPVLYLCYAVPAVIVLSIIMVPFQVADELEHIERADQISRGKLVSNREGGNIEGNWAVVGALYQKNVFSPAGQTDYGVGAQGQPGSLVRVNAIRQFPGNRAIRTLFVRAAGCRRFFGPHNRCVPRPHASRRTRAQCHSGLPHRFRRALDLSMRPIIDVCGTASADDALAVCFGFTGCAAD